MPVFRLAEMYLNKAEAAMELGKTGDAATALNMVRERAGIRTLSAGEVSLDRIRNERRVELAYENHRHWDLKRWHIAHIKLADFPTWRFIHGISGGKVNISLRLVRLRNLIRYSWNVTIT